MNFFRIRLGLSAPQELIVQAIKNDGGDAIQMSDGLFVRSPRASLESALIGIEGAATARIEPALTIDDSFTPDMRKFMEAT